jgi:hypothetical protein
MASIGEATSQPAMTGSRTFDSPVEPSATAQQQVAFPVEFPYPPRVVVTLQSDAPVALFFGVSSVDSYGFVLTCLNQDAAQQQPTVTWLAQ